MIDQEDYEASAVKIAAENNRQTANLIMAVVLVVVLVAVVIFVVKIRKKK